MTTPSWVLQLCEIHGNLRDAILVPTKCYQTQEIVKDDHKRSKPGSKQIVIYMCKGTKREKKVTRE